ncbi:MAG: helicase-associated domain-containing protein [Candidatus Sumerlaeia bacterium]
MKLKSALKSLKIEDLQSISQFWDFPDGPEEQLEDADQWIEHLYPRMQNPSHFHEVFVKLSRFQRKVVQFLAIHGGNLSEKELKQRCFRKSKKTDNGDEIPDFKATMELLEQRGFVFYERWKGINGKSNSSQRIYGIPEPFLRMIELPHVWQNYLGKILRDISTDQLQALVSNGLGIKAPSNKRDALIFAVRDKLTDPDTLRTYIDSLPEDQRETLHLIMQRRGVCLYRDLLELMQKRSKNLVRGDAVEALLHSSGLLFQATNNPSKYENLLRVPRDIYYMITHHFVHDKRDLDSLDTLNQVDDKKAPKIILDNGISILRDLVIFVGYVSRHGVRRLGNGGIGKNDLKKVLTRLSANKTLKYAMFLSYYAIHRKFLVPKGDTWETSDDFESYLRDSRAWYLDLYECWFESKDWNEEYIDGDCLHTDNYASNLIHISELRKLVLANLAELPFDTWVDGPRFIESLLAQVEVRIPHRGGRAHLEKYNRINYLVIESILCESLYWLGLVSLGLHEKTEFSSLGNRDKAYPSTKGGENGQDHSRFDQHFNFNPRPMLPDSCQFYFQVNGLGHSILENSAGIASDLLEKQDSIALPFRDDMIHFTVLPNLDVVAPPDLNLVRFFKLRQFAEVRHMDVMSIFSITHDSLRSGLEMGISAEEILTFLEESCPNGLPETVKHLIDECAEHFGEIALGYAGGYIKVKDPVLLENLRNNKALKPYIKDMPDSHVLILGRDADIHAVVRELHRLNFMPTVDSESVCVQPDGRLRFALTQDQLGSLMALLEFVMLMENEMDVNLTEDAVRPLLHALRPASHPSANVEHFAQVKAASYEKKFEAAINKKLNAVANKYRKQMREFLAHRPASKPHVAYSDANPATKPKDIKKLLRFAIDEDSQVQVRYTNSSKEELVEVVTPESLNGDKLFAFCEERQNYCAYRIARIVSVELV